MSDSLGWLLLLLIVGVFILILYVIAAAFGIALIVAAGYGLVRTVINYVAAFKDVMKQRDMPRIIPIIIPLAVIAAGGLFFLFENKRLMQGRRNNEILEASKEEETTQDLVETEQESWEDEEDQEQEQETSVDYEDVQVNGVDQEYIQVVGTVFLQDGMETLYLPEAVSVCAYDSEGEIVREESVEYLVIADNMGVDYVDEEVMIEGSLSVMDSGEFKIDATWLEAIGGETAEAEDETDFETHNYEIIVADVTWQEAYEDCKNRGGYLLQINSEEEFQSVIQMIEEEGKQNIHFYLGGRREESASEYYWVDEDNVLEGDILNPEADTWMSPHWMENEPSIVSGEEVEMYMNLLYYQEQWVFNDVPMDITMYYPQKTGYICEFNE